MNIDDEVVVSICMITYNHSHFISQAIEGVMMQKCSFSFELVIGEDCSTDETRSICFKYERRYPKKINLIVRDKNIGMMPNFLNTLYKCKGKYIAICEGDDFWTDPLKLQKQVEFLDAHSEFGLVHSDCDFYYNDNKKLIRNWDKRSRNGIPEGDVYEKLLINNFVKTLTVCFRRDLLYNSIFFEIVKGHKLMQGDYFMWLLFSLHTKFHYISDSMAVRRILPESASNFALRKDRLKFNLTAFDINLFFIEKYGCSDYVKDEVCINRNKVLLRYHYFLNDTESAKIAFREIRKKTSLFKIGLKELIYYFVLKNKFVKRTIGFVLPEF